VDKRRSRHRLCLVLVRLLVLAFSVLLSCSLLNMRPTWAEGSPRANTSEPATSLDPDALSNGDGDADIGSEATGAPVPTAPIEPAAGATPPAAVPPGGGRHHTSELFRPPRSTPAR
jgi:hypothetical protein